MSLVLYVIIVIAAFVFMEGVAWFAHKYIMHGLLWHLHQDHHRPLKGFFEKNDFFFLIFAVPGWLCIMLGWQDRKLVCCKHRLRYNLIWVGLFSCS
jgi:beta-carotene 3-hydroxylase